MANRGLITLRVDDVVTRQDGSAVRLHPSERKEAAIIASTLEGWRLGSTPVHVLDEGAVKAYHKLLEKMGGGTSLVAA